MPSDIANTRQGRLATFLDHDLVYSFLHTPTAFISAAVLLVIVVTALLAPWISPQDPHDLTQLFLDRSELPPVWIDGGELPYLLGTDQQGRDVFSALLYGSRISLFIGFLSVVIASLIGIAVGLLAGYVGGLVDAGLMRFGDLMLSIPNLMVAILFAAVFREILSPALRDQFAPLILTGAIVATSWVSYARLVRARTLVESRKEYVMASRILHTSPIRIMVAHIMPNALTPLLVAAPLQLGLAVLAEAVLSFLGVGMPPDQPSLGTLIRIGNEYFFSGSWWVVIFPAVQLSVIILSVNLLGDWIRTALNPKLRDAG
ncbi:MAG: ABC transporter permease [Paracoccaceae bacterium]